MTPQIITVYNIHDAIEDVGIQSYANTLVQEMGRQYFYVEVELLGCFEFTPTPADVPGYTIWENTNIDFDDPDWEEGCREYYKYRVWPIPLRLAWFCIDALKLKSSAINLGDTEYDEPGKQAVYLTPGKELFGTKIDKLTEIPAELRPVGVEKL